jgi:hypothetical protein
MYSQAIKKKVRIKQVNFNIKLILEKITEKIANKAKIPEKINKEDKIIIVKGGGNKNIVTKWLKCDGKFRTVTFYKKVTEKYRDILNRFNGGGSRTFIYDFGDQGFAVKLRQSPR